ncbi:MAG: 50S ribosomal protein L18e [Nitrososphaerota archaeon]
MEKYRHLIRTVSRLSKEENFWEVIANNLQTPRRRRRVVNLYELNRLTSPNDRVIVLGKLLGTGVLKHPLTIVAFDFSSKSYQKVKSIGGTPIFLEDFIKTKPSISGFKIIG